MVSPEIEQLSVFMTPWMKPTSSQRATSSAWRATTRFEQRVIGRSASRSLRIVARDDVVGERRTPSVSPRAAKNWKVPTRIWLDATRVSTAPGSMVSRWTRSPVTHGGERARGRNAQRGHRLADDVFPQHRPERGAAVAPARERRRAGALELDVAPHAVRSTTSPSRMARPSPSCGTKWPNWWPA